MIILQANVIQQMAIHCIYYQQMIQSNTICQVISPEINYMYCNCLSDIIGYLILLHTVVVLAMYISLVLTFVFQREVLLSHCLETLSPSLSSY